MLDDKWISYIEEDIKKEKKREKSICRKILRLGLDLIKFYAEVDTKAYLKEHKASVVVPA